MRLSRDSQDDVQVPPNSDEGGYDSMASFDRCTITVSQDVLFQPLGEDEDEVVLLDMRSGGYFGLNEVGSRVWQLIHDVCVPDIGRIIASLLEEYEVPEEDLRADVQMFLAELSERGLICINQTGAD